MIYYQRPLPSPELSVQRGNLNTRLSKLDSPTSHFSALILAIAGMTRLGQAHRITAPLPSPVLMHAVGQGAERRDRQQQQRPGTGRRSGAARPSGGCCGCWKAGVVCPWAWRRRWWN